MLEQMNMYGRDKIEQAIDRLQKFEPAEGYYMAFSGGKDSVTLKALADMAGVKYKAVYSVTSVDPPELVQFVKTFPDVSMEIPRDKNGNAVTMWNLIPKKSMPPTRIVRYCCVGLKEHMGFPGGVKLTGVRWDESPRRKNTRGGLEVAATEHGKHTIKDPDTIDAEEAAEIMEQYTKILLNPIIDWTDADVWQFIHENGVAYCSLYDEGFARLGCIGCPLAGPGQQEKEFERWPKYKENYMAAFSRMVENAKARAKAKGAPYIGYKDAEAVMNWWLKKDQQQGVTTWNGQSDEKTKSRRARKRGAYPARKRAKCWTKNWWDLRLFFRLKSPRRTW